jgi:hypothetical protein
MNLETLTESILEKTTPTISAYLADEDDAAISKSSVLTLKLTLYNKTTKVIINSRADLDALDANGVTVTEDSNGTLVEWEMEVDDTAVLGTRGEEEHRAVFEWTWGSPVKTGRHIIDMTIVNLEKVT